MSSIPPLARRLPFLGYNLIKAACIDFFYGLDTNICGIGYWKVFNGYPYKKPWR